MNENKSNIDTTGDNIQSYTLVGDLLNNDDDEYNNRLAKLEKEANKMLGKEADKIENSDVNSAVTESGVTVIHESITIDLGDQESFSEKEASPTTPEVVKDQSEIIEEERTHVDISELTKATESNFVVLFLCTYLSYSLLKYLL